MATFVQVTEEDPALDLVNLVLNIKYGSDDEAKAVEKEKQLTSLKEAVAAHKYYDVLDEGVLSSMDSILSAEWRDINAVFNLSFSLITTLPAGEAERIINKLTAALVSSEEHSPLKIKLLTTLFNLVDASLRFHVLRDILKYIVKTNNSAMVADRLGKVDDWVRSWKLDDNSAAVLYRLVAEVSQQNNKSAEAHAFTQKYFECLESCDEKAMESAKSWVVQNVNAAIQASDISLCDRLLNFKAVLHLKKDAATEPLLELLRIVSSESVAAYQRFAEQHKTLFEQHGFDQSKLLAKMRTLTLCTIASSKSSISFDELKSELEVKDDDSLEQCVVEAVMSGHLEAKIDEQKRVVSISYAAARNFNHDSWVRIGEKLQSWRQSLAVVQESLRENLHDQ